VSLLICMRKADLTQYSITHSELFALSTPEFHYKIFSDSMQGQ